MPPRRPVSAAHSTVVPTLLALLASGVALTVASEAHAQPHPRDGGVQPVRPPHPHPPAPGGIRPVQPPPPPPPPPPDQHPAGGMARVHPHPPPRVK